MAKNKKKQSKKAMITIPEIEYKFLKSQNELLLKQNRELQKLIKSRNTRTCGITDSLGFALLNKLSGGKYGR